MVLFLVCVVFGLVGLFSLRIGTRWSSALCVVAALLLPVAFRIVEGSRANRCFLGWWNPTC